MLEIIIQSNRTYFYEHERKDSLVIQKNNFASCLSVAEPSIDLFHNNFSPSG